MRNTNGKTFAIGIVAVIVLLGVAVITMVSTLFSGGAPQGSSPGAETSGKTLAELVEDVDYTYSDLVKGAVSMGENNLYDELPSIEKYPVLVQGRGDVDIEIFSSGEKAGKLQDSWLVDCATAFNSANRTLATGESVSLTVRSMGSGLGADYILSGKYSPDLYTPSNSMFADYAIANGADMELYLDRSVGNTAGILVRKGSGYSSVDDVLRAVMDGGLDFGYTNPQNSASGVNLLVYLMQANGGVGSDEARSALERFNQNIPFVAYTTQQMTVSAANGTLDAMVSEYQAYVNDANLSGQYDFIPYGMRHDNPIYLVNPAGHTDRELSAIRMICDYLTGNECQRLASEKGFNYLDDYASSYSATGAEVGQALSVYKKSKDAGRDVIAVFVVDCSGSMAGTAMQELKESLTNGMQYVNDDSMVGLVSYSDWVHVDVPINKFDLTQRAYFQGAVNRLEPDATTHTYEALCVALNMIEAARKDHPDAKCMIFLQSDGKANGRYGLDTVRFAVENASVPVYTIAYTDDADKAELSRLSDVNEAVSVSADSDDIVYHIKTLFNSQL